MAAAAYGAVVSLMHLLDNLQHPFRQQLHYDRHQIEILREKVSFLLEFLEDYSEILCHTETEDLARQIAHVFDEAEKIIDSHVVDQLINQRSGYEFGLFSFSEDRDNVLNKIESIKNEYEVDKGLSSFREYIDNVLNKIESIKKELMIVKDQKKRLHLRQRSASSSAPPSGGDKINIMVGFEEHLERIMDQLTAHESDLQIVPITGMGGIGKTTLAQNAFASRHIEDHFDLCKWITISQSYSIQDVVLGLLDNKNNSKSKQNLPELGEQLHKMLFGRRYLIVMDDVWSAEVWDELRRFFPNNKNRSRIVVTTRLLEVADSFGSQNPYLMDFLDEKKSWNLFCIKVFGKEICPNPELEKIGKSIVEYCKGLPLAISVIGGLLRKSNTIEDWELVAKNVMKSLANSKDEEDCSNILSLSYRHLPIHLKPCFLYMRVFDEDEMIEVDRLVNYWIAEGFVKLKGGKTLEEVASEYLKDLINRNLILIHEFDSYSGDVRKCKVHDLLRDLCIREYEKEHIFCTSKVRYDYLQSKSTCFQCRSQVYEFPHASSITQVAATPVFCLVCEACNGRLVRISDGFLVHYQHTRLRYLETRRNWKNSLPLLWNLQFLKSHVNNTELSVGILLEMPQLRHLYVDSVIHVDPPVTEIGYREDCVILEDLQTLTTEMNFRYSEEIFKRIPNVKTLTLSYRNSWQRREVDRPVHPFHNLVDLHKLETLVCSYINLEYISFPNSMKILKLKGCLCSWERMTIIGSLPNLEVLELRATRGEPEWNPIEGEFLQLKTLSIGYNDLVQWNAEKYHFPKLERLYLEGMNYLEKIPPGIGEIETLKEIWLNFFTESLVQSAKEIIEEQREYGNEELQLVLQDLSSIGGGGSFSPESEDYIRRPVCC